jgi:hypothetical protein
LRSHYPYPGFTLRYIALFIIALSMFACASQPTTTKSEVQPPPVALCKGKRWNWPQDQAKDAARKMLEAAEPNPKFPLGKHGWTSSKDENAQGYLHVKLVDRDGQVRAKTTFALEPASPNQYDFPKRALGGTSRGSN